LSRLDPLRQALPATKKRKARVGALRKPDSRAPADGIDCGAVAADPQRAAGKQINPVVPQIDPQSRSQSSGSAREIEQPFFLACAARVLARAAHMVDSGQGFECTQQHTRARSAPLARYVEHVRRAVAQIHIGVAGLLETANDCAGVMPRNAWQAGSPWR